RGRPAARAPPSGRRSSSTWADCPRRPTSAYPKRVSRIAWIALLVAGLALVAGILAAALLVGGSGAKRSPVETVSAVPKAISLPLQNDPDALMLAQHEQDILAGIAARPGGPVEIALLRGETPIPTAQLTVRIGGGE